jgi:hypothetical protein
MKTEVSANLERIDEALAHETQYLSLRQIFQVPLSTTVYFSNPTFFKLQSLDKTANQAVNEKISKVYVSWQVANNLIQSCQPLELNYRQNPAMSQVNLLKNNTNILDILKRTRQPAEEILKAIEGEPGPS